MNIDFVTLKPTQEVFELRTLLVIREYGSHPKNILTEVHIIGALNSRWGKNHKGQQIKIIPLTEGSTISYVEHFVIDNSYLYIDKRACCDCPKYKTALVARTV